MSNSLYIAISIVGPINGLEELLKIFLCPQPDCSPLGCIHHRPCIYNNVVGLLVPVISIMSLTSTSVIITWTQPEFSLPVISYTVSLSLVTGSGQALCTGYMDSRPSVTTMAGVTSMNFMYLQEFSKYNVTVTARFSVTFSNSPKTVSMQFTTPSAGKKVCLKIHTPLIALFYSPYWSTKKWKFLRDFHKLLYQLAHISLYRV